MTSPSLENLACIGKLEAEAPAQGEFNGLVASALLNDLIEITGRLLDAVEKLGPIAGTKPS